MEKIYKQLLIFIGGYITSFFGNFKLNLEKI